MSELTPLGDEPIFAGGLHEIAPGTYAWLQPNGGLGESNAGLIVGDGESLLIDTLWDERLTARMLEVMASPTADAPVTRLFNTHGDGDHWYGNGLLPDTVEIIATEEAAAQMADEPPTLLTRMRPLPFVAGLAGALPLNPIGARLRGLARFGKALDAYDFNGITPRRPDTTFAAELGLEVGGREVALYKVGPAHTPGDAFAWLPDTRTVFSGDICFSGVTPIIWAGPAENWRIALRLISELAPTEIVPGHGPVSGPELIEDLLAYWVAIEAAVIADGGADPTGLATRIVRSPEYAMAPWGSWLAPERTLINVAMIAREINEGRTGPVSTAKRIALISAMGELAESL